MLQQASASCFDMQVVAQASVPMPPGLSGCTFDAGLTLQGGVLVAAGPPAAAGQQYPVALVIRCLSSGAICTDSYLAVYNYSTATRALRWVILVNKTALQGVFLAASSALWRARKQVCTTAMKCHLLVNGDSSCTLSCRFVRKAHLQTLRSFANFAGSPGPVVCVHAMPLILVVLRRSP